MKIILFDLDGTLLRSQNGHVAFNEAILRTFGFPGDIRTVRPDGKTDPEILQNIFDAAHQRIEWGREHWASFSDHLEECYHQAIVNGHTRVLALPGVAELVFGLSQRENIAQGVVTGNMQVTGRLKLEAAGLGDYIGPGAFGSDSARRADLPRIAMERWQAHLKRPVYTDDCVIVGDTPRDLEAARENGMKCLLVGTGRYPMEELELLDPDHFLADFTDTERAIEVLLRLFE
jgi:phosphoglycolate phosphatase